MVVVVEVREGDFGGSQVPKCGMPRPLTFAGAEVSACHASRIEMTIASSVERTADEEATNYVVKFELQGQCIAYFKGPKTW